MSWNSERVGLLMKLWAKGLSGSQIAEKLGGDITRSAVIAKVHRLALAGRKTNAKPRKAQRAKNAFGIEKKPKAPTETAYVDPPIEEADVPTVTFHELEWNDGRCRWRIDVPFRGAPYGFCGRETLPGLSECHRHARRMYSNWAEVQHRYVKARKKEEVPA